MPVFLKTVVLLFGAALLAGFLTLFGLYLRYSLPKTLEEAKPNFQLFDRHGQPLRPVPDAEHRQQEWTPLDAISPWLVQATIAAEDKRFYRHLGIDLLAIGRALLQWKDQAQIVSGASTISQQVIKIHDPRPRTFLTKIREALLAIKLERRFNKNQILEIYLNRIDYGNQRIGIGAASQLYFNQSPHSLSPSQAAFLAGLPNAPSRLNPYRPEGLSRALRRRDLILHRMHRLQMLDDATLQRALQEPIHIQPRKNSFKAPHFEDYLLSQHSKAAQAIAAAQPYRVKTTLDGSLNQTVEEILTRHLHLLRGRDVHEAAAVVLHNPTGGLLALVGSGNYFDEKDGQINGALIPRSPGSALKPFTYAIALEKDYTAASILPDVPAAFPSPRGLYRPQNFSNSHRGPVLLAEALGNSLNVPAVSLLQQLGGPSVLQRKLSELGFTTLHRAPDDYGLGLTIGTAEVTLLELTNAYATLARLGEWKPLSFFLARPASSESRRVFSATTAYLITRILSDPENRAETFGHASGLQIPFPVAIKTGTSTNYRDNWCLGYTPEFTVGVWMGNFDGTPTRRVSSVMGAAPAFRDIMETLHRRYGTSSYQQPADCAEITVDAWTGTLPSSFTRKTRRLPFARYKQPSVSDASHYDPKTGRLLLDARYAEWLASAENYFGKQATLQPRSTRSWTLFPIPGTIFILDPDLPASSRNLRLRIQNAPSTVSISRVEAPTLQKISARGDQLVMDPGRHTIKVYTDETAFSTWIEVREE